MAPSILRFSKRNVPIGLPAIVGIAVGAAALGVTLLIVCWLIRRLRKQRQTMSIVDSAQKYAMRSSSESASKTPQKTSNYQQIIMSLQALDQNKISPREEKFSHASVVEGSKNSQEHRIFDAPMPSLPAPTLKSYRRRSVGTESIYSSASAPLEYHDHLFRPFELNSSPSLSASSTDVESDHDVFRIAREFHTTWRTRSLSRTRHQPSDMSPVPSVSDVQLPDSIHLYSASHERHPSTLAPILPLVIRHPYHKEAEIIIPSDDRS